MHPSLQIFFLIYGLAWTFALPFLFISRRLRTGWQQRIGLGISRGTYDLWIQAASGGEAYLALEIIKGLRMEKQTILLTTNTAQGLDILRTNLHRYGINPEPEIRLCPLDHPLVVNRFMRHIRPRVVVLLETEIWPSLLMASTRNHCPILLANGRLSLRSLAGYLPFRALLARMAPTTVMAVSSRDKQRFDAIFNPETTVIMPNIKFDRILNQQPLAYITNPLSRFFKPGSRLIVLGSVREEEEPDLMRVIIRLLADHPTTIIAIVPRHMHRLRAWKNFLQMSNKTWRLRSELKGHVKPGTIVLWDVFGELSSIYALARNVFVGGSLAPLGGQNFLEPLAQGICPVIGPFWENFHWVGQEIIDKGLVRMVQNVDELTTVLGTSPKKSREIVRARAEAYLNAKKGGTAMVCKKINAMIVEQDQKQGKSGKRTQ